MCHMLAKDMAARNGPDLEVGRWRPREYRMAEEKQ